jgi:hypothetical protein
MAAIRHSKFPAGAIISKFIAVKSKNWCKDTTKNQKNA